MKSILSVAASLAALSTQVSGHYIFDQFTYGGTLFPAYQYIRKNTNDNSPVTDLTSDDLRCNVGGETGGSTQTITVKAGAAFSFTSDIAVYHDGPLSMYMAKAPSGTTAATFDGSGQVWFKIMDLGPTFASGTATWPLAQTYSYHIPSALPNGDYLLRIQQLAIHNPYPAGTPQFYIECAQVTVTGGGSGTPSPLVSIPGFITGTEPGYTVNIYSDFTNYTVPGPAVWAGEDATGGSGGGSASTPAGPTSAASTPASTFATSVASTPVKTSTVPTSTGAVVPQYGQCGGTGWTGAIQCAAGTKCTASGSYYSQCL
ncbi:putative endo-beta-1,4-glucanase D [Lachnellula suecica]|uniref:AA9 family lytic polysaccharide monooxygenase n=1 Tax=Lachnellula suecica TaxID=602035 RepID=A0A8T9CIJ0_9HELO|nr:putative endo-beta-1,4-glucanase D [Lachnellula suecica]